MAMMKFPAPKIVVVLSISVIQFILRTYAVSLFLLSYRLIGFLYKFNLPNRQCYFVCRLVKRFLWLFVQKKDLWNLLKNISPGSADSYEVLVIKVRKLTQYKF